MKKCIFVLSQFNSDNKVQLLERSVSSLKKLGIPVISLSTVQQPESVLSMVDDFVLCRIDDCNFQDFFLDHQLDQARNSSGHISHFFPSGSDEISYLSFSYGRGKSRDWPLVSQFIEISRYAKENGYTNFLVVHGDTVLSQIGILKAQEFFSTMESENLDFIFSLKPKRGHISASAWFSKSDFWNSICEAITKEDFIISTYPTFSSELYLTEKLKKIESRGNLFVWDEDGFSSKDFPNSWNVFQRGIHNPGELPRALNLLFPDNIEIRQSFSRKDEPQSIFEPFSHISMGTGVRENQPVFFILNEYSEDVVKKVGVKVEILNHDDLIFSTNYTLYSECWAWTPIFNLSRDSSCRVEMIIESQDGSFFEFRDQFSLVGVDSLQHIPTTEKTISCSVLVVNLNNLQFTKDCIQDLFEQDTLCSITVVDQSSTEPGTDEFLNEISVKGVNVIRNTSNQPLNHLWNSFAESADTPYVCLLNNDVRLSPNFLSSAIDVFEREPNVGFVNHTTNSLEFSAWSKDLKYHIMDHPYRQGWDPIFRKECYHKIPDDILFFFGDDYIYSKLYESGMKGAYVLNSPILHFERSTTEEKGGIRDCSKDSEYFHLLDLQFKNMNFSDIFCKWKPEFDEITGEAKYTKENYITVDPDVKEWESHLNYSILSRYSDILSGRVADFGCNHGACTILAARNEKIESITGLDINEESIRIAKDLLASCREDLKVKNKVTFKSGDLSNLNRLQDDQFDSAFCFHTLEHIYPSDYDSVFSEWKRVIKNGGDLIISVPYLRAHDDPSHVNYFDEESLSRLFTSGGFSVSECYREQKENFDCLNLVAKVVKEGVDLSIIICSLTERRNRFLNRLLVQLEKQTFDLDNVEIIVLSDNAMRPIGTKRNDGLKLALGKYVCFVDDDDMVADDYVASILHEIRVWKPDVIVFDAIISFDGSNHKLVKYGREFDHTESEEAYFRRPNHLMVHKKSNITEFFMDLKTGEDDEWASRMLDRIVTQSRINKVLYYYDYRTSTKKYFE